MVNVIDVMHNLMTINNDNTSINVDVVVAGVGIAGAFTLNALPKKFDVIGIDKKKELGYPVECGEIVPTKKEMKHLFSLNDYSIFEIPRKFESNKTKVIKFILPNGREIDVEFEMHVIKRDEMIKEIAKKSGHKLILGKRFDFNGAIFVNSERFNSKIIVASDGANSRIAKKLKIRYEFSAAKQYLMRGFEGDEDVIYMYVGKVISPGAYAWIIPKGDGYANVGTGFRFKFAEKENNIHKALNYFINEYKYSSYMLKKAEIVEKIGAIVPIDLPKRTVYDNILFIGDSASMVISHVGAGIPTSMLAGDIAGDVITKHLEEKIDLSEYERRWREAMFETMKNGYFIRKLWDKIASNDDKLIKYFKLIDEKDMKLIIRGKVPIKLKLANFLIPILNMIF